MWGNGGMFIFGWIDNGSFPGLPLSDDFVSFMPGVRNKKFNISEYGTYIVIASYGLEKE